VRRFRAILSPRGAAVVIAVGTFLAFSGSGEGPKVIKRVDSRNASAGVNCDEGGGSLRRGDLGDVFFLPRQPTMRTTRCTWLDNDFSRMGRYEVYDVVLRFDLYAQSDAEHAAIAMIRPVGTDLEGDVCGLTGNKEILFVRVYIDWDETPDHWKLQLRGGASPWARDQNKNLSTVDLGPVVQGVSIDLTFDLFFDYAHGAATVWKDGERVYANRDRPLGFHYNCDYRSSNADTTSNQRARDLSHSYLHMQHGIYRHATPAWRLTSSGFRFYCSQRTPCDR
jgi:hypothetical protein